jgi:hypothetical protein
MTYMPGEGLSLWMRLQFSSMDLLGNGLLGRMGMRTYQSVWYLALLQADRAAWSGEQSGMGEDQS